MATIDDYAAIAAELRRKQAEQRPGKNGAPGDPAQHRMRITVDGEQLYRRLVAQERDRPLKPGRGSSN